MPTHCQLGFVGMSSLNGLDDRLMFFEDRLGPGCRLLLREFSYEPHPEDDLRAQHAERGFIHCVSTCSGQREMEPEIGIPESLLV